MSEKPASPAPGGARLVNPSMAVSMTLFLASLAGLSFGGFVQFDDTSGFGGEHWNLPVGYAAGLLALASVAVAIGDRWARRALGAALAVLAVLLVGGSVADEEFRFIWRDDEGELFYLQVVTGLAALVLLTPAFWSSEQSAERVPRRTLSPWARVALYATALVLAMFAAFHAGVAHFESTQCSGPDDGGECDVAVLEGLLWTGVVFLLMLGAILVGESVRARRRRRQRRSESVMLGPGPGAA